MWTTVLIAAAGCYLLKLAGLSVPPRWLEGERFQRVAMLVPIALLAALIATQTFGDGKALTVDARAAGLAVAGGAVAARAPFLVVVVLASGVTALLRAIT
jgi:branched-subunit amino acid transport protein